MALENITNTNNVDQETPQKQANLSESAVTSSETTAIAQSEVAKDATVKTGGPDGAYESPYIKELQKNIRNVTKKLAAMQKVDSVIADNPGVPLDDLVASKKINNDQKAQALKKPSLKAQLAQFEEQIAGYKKFEEDYQARAAKEKAALEATHLRELETLRVTAKAEATVEAEAGIRQKLLTLSRFLRAAAARRQLEDDLSEESKAFEGLLLLLFGGDNAAVDAAEKLINGAEEGVISTEDLPLNVSYAKIKELSEAYAPFAAEEAWRQEVANADQNHAGDVAVEPAVQLETDPTIAHAGLTELQQDLPILQAEVMTSRELANVDGVATNDTTAVNWEATGSSTQDPMGDSWVSVPRELAEATKTETPLSATINQSSQNWADDVAEPIETAAPPPTDGFHEVHHYRTSGRGRGGPGVERGGRGRGGYRGDGNGHRGRGSYRGDRGGEYRGRGRGGGPRGARGSTQ